jgi:hypothetical protein
LTAADALAFETYCIDALGSHTTRHGYNRSLGGDGPTGVLLSEETRARLSECRRGRVCSPETRARMSAAQAGRVVSDDTRRKLSEAQRGIPKAPRTKEHGANIGLSRREPFKEKKAEALAALALGERVVDIAARLGVHWSSIYNWRRENVKTNKEDR